jgi:hypothetical protein
MSPIKPAVATSPVDTAVSNRLVRDIANLKAKLATDKFQVNPAPADIQRQREQIEQLLASLEHQLDSPQRPGANLDEAVALPQCYDSIARNLNHCFIFAEHRIAIDPATGHVSQVTGIVASQSAVVAYSLDGSQKPSVPVGGPGWSLSGTTLEKDFAYPAPDCNVSAHSVQSNVTHQISWGIVSAGGVGLSLSGFTNSPGGASCVFKGLTVTLNKSSISTTNDYATFDVTGLQECVVPGAVTADSKVATVSNISDNHFRVDPKGAGTTTITATCGTQYGVASITVTQPETCSDSVATLGIRRPSGDTLPIHRLSTPCGTLTGTPGTGGGTPPSPDPSVTCQWHWARDYVVYSDGSWDWLTSWYQSCDYATRAPKSPVGAIGTHPSDAAAAAVAPQLVRVRILGTGLQRGAPSVSLFRDIQSDVDAFIRVDTTRATPADLESALVSIQYVYGGPAIPVGAVLGVILSGPSPQDKANAQSGSRATGYLNQLQNAAERTERLIGHGRALDVMINTRSNSQP